jgi:uncharacterized protein YdaU (DUF1376 family)
MHYYPHHIGDFLRDTASLSPTESYFYLRLIWLYYESESPLPDDPEVLAFKIGARDHLESVSLLLRTFFRYESDLKSYRHQRIDLEISKYQKKAASAKVANRKRWASEMDLKSDADQIPTNNQEPITNISKQKNSFAKPDGVPDDLWQDFKQTRKAKRAPITKVAMDGIQREAKLAGIHLGDALRIVCERGWTSFKADWYLNDKAKPASQKTDTAPRQLDSIMKGAL